jgi:hypothetical protein
VVERHAGRARGKPQGRAGAAGAGEQVGHAEHKSHLAAVTWRSMATPPTKATLRAKHTRLQQQASDLSTAFTHRSMKKEIVDRTQDLDDALDLLNGKSESPAVLMSIEYLLKGVAGQLAGLKNALGKYGKDARLIG